MADLRGIKTSVQQVAEAIGIALKVEVEIVDNKLNIVGGTGVYQDMLGMKEEKGNLRGNYLYARTLRVGKTQYVADALADRNYDEKGAGGTVYGERAEICTPIILKGRPIGIIGLVAFSEEQKEILSDTNRNMIGFVERMAELLAAKADQQETLENAEESRDEMTTVLETAHEGIFALDQTGYVKHCNAAAAALLKTTKRELVGTHISKLMPDSPAAKVLKTGVGYTENEEVLRVGRDNLHFIIAVKPYMKGDEIQGIVVSFRDVTEANKPAAGTESEENGKEREQLISNHCDMNKTLSEQVKDFEREVIIRKMKQCGGVKETVARKLGLSRATLYRKLAELDID